MGLPNLERHRTQALAERQRLASLENHSRTLSGLRLLSFLGIAALTVAAFTSGQYALVYAAAAGALTCIFIVLVVLHWRLAHRQRLCALHQQCRDTYLSRAEHQWQYINCTGLSNEVPQEHPYATDIDLYGRQSLWHLINVTHTLSGETTLRTWLDGPSETTHKNELHARHEALKELQTMPDWRCHFEVAAMLGADDKQRLDEASFARWLSQAQQDLAPRWSITGAYLLPFITLSMLGHWLIAANMLPLWLIPAGLQLGLVFLTQSKTRTLFDSIAQRRTYAEALLRMSRQVETTTWQSKSLQKLRQPFKDSKGKTLSSKLKRFDTWVNLATLHHQPLLHIVINPLLLWDLHIALRMQAWKRARQAQVSEALGMLGHLEALCSLSVLLDIDPQATFPEIIASEEGLKATNLAHPLLLNHSRVGNDVNIGGPGQALIITGSNMAGKSTLLRAIGLNIVLGLAGGPVIAKDMRIPRVRLRSNMRIDDSLQQGASYFHAELLNVQRLIHQLDQSPPVFFLLDELLRGTNTHAQALGARAIIKHLLSQGSFGLIATHDINLSQLEDEYPQGQISNMHFTDKMREDEMYFDYTLRPGIVKHSNALKLLAKAGIAVPEQN